MVNLVWLFLISNNGDLQSKFQLHEMKTNLTILYKIHQSLRNCLKFPLSHEAFEDHFFHLFPCWPYFRCQHVWKQQCLHMVHLIGVWYHTSWHAVILDTASYYCLYLVAFRVILFSLERLEAPSGQEPWYKFAFYTEKGAKDTVASQYFWYNGIVYKLKVGFFVCFLHFIEHLFILNSLFVLHQQQKILHLEMLCVKPYDK